MHHRQLPILTPTNLTFELPRRRSKVKLFSRTPNTLCGSILPHATSLHPADRCLFCISAPAIADTKLGPISGLNHSHWYVKKVSSHALFQDHGGLHFRHFGHLRQDRQHNYSETRGAELMSSQNVLRKLITTSCYNFSKKWSGEPSLWMLWVCGSAQSTYLLENGILTTRCRSHIPANSQTK